MVSYALVQTPTAFEIRQKNAAFENQARQGKKPTKPSRAEQAAKRAPLSLWALSIIVFVVCGGLIFEIARLLFL
ncbi:hypothetical protein M422DRAFT_241896 [Sphaerobolus stellatus SS14]|nr:hypothetical protein M422DRAFT_241896 [Sphaerobolus stellatus SS14]